MSYEDESKIVPCYEVPKDFIAKGPCDLPCEGPIPLSIRKTGVERVIGRTILEASCHLGSYGMGGAGFLGLGMEKTDQYPIETLILCLWAADEWVHYDGKPIFAINKTFDAYGQKKFIDDVTGKVLKSFDITDKGCKIMLDETVMEITEDPKTRPTYGGSGGYRTLLETDSLLDAWVISSTPYVAI